MRSPTLQCCYSYFSLTIPGIRLKFKSYIETELLQNNLFKRRTHWSLFKPVMWRALSTSSTSFPRRICDSQMEIQPSVMCKNSQGVFIFPLYSYTILFLFCLCGVAMLPQQFSFGLSCNVWGYTIIPVLDYQPPCTYTHTGIHNHAWTNKQITTK